MEERLVVIIVFYNPTTEQINQAKSLGIEYHIIIVDNSDEVLNVFDGDPHFSYIPLKFNKGIARAQNVGIKHAQKLKARYILFQDQDSYLRSEDINCLVDEFNKIKKADSHIAAIGPMIINESTNEEYKTELENVDTAIVSSIISSGMLVIMETLKDVGLMEEDLFIDNVDHEWCWRAKKKGYHIYMTRRVFLKHRVGLETKKMLGMQIIKSSPLRYYYKYRNNIWLIKRNYVPFSWKIKTVAHMIIEYVLFYVKRKEYGRDYIRNAKRGVIEAVANFREV